MKTLRLLSVMILLTIAANTSAKDLYKWDKTTVTYNGNQYLIKTNDLMCVIWNEKYIFPEGTVEHPLNKNQQNDYMDRVNNLYNKINSIAYSVFPANLWSRLKMEHFMFTIFFDTKTSNYVGIDFFFDLSLKNIVTINKIYQIEQKLNAAHLNAGKIVLKDPNKEYFEL